MKGLDVAARQIARLAGWAIDETLAKVFPPPKAMTADGLLDYLARIETDKEVLDPGDCDCVLGSPTPWSHEDHPDDREPCGCKKADPPWQPWERELHLINHPDPSTGAAGPQPPQQPDAGAGGRLTDEITSVLTVILRRHLSKNLGLAGAIAPVVAKASAVELLAHFDMERKA